MAVYQNARLQGPVDAADQEIRQKTSLWNDTFPLKVPGSALNISHYLKLGGILKLVRSMRAGSMVGQMCHNFAADREGWWCVSSMVGQMCHSGI